MSDRAGHRRPISAIGDVQLCGDELIGQDQTGIRLRSCANGSLQYVQQLALGVTLAAQCQAIHRPRIGIIFPVTLWLRTKSFLPTRAEKIGTYREADQVARRLWSAKRMRKMIGSGPVHQQESNRADEQSYGSAANKFRIIAQERLPPRAHP